MSNKTIYKIVIEPLINKYNNQLSLDDCNHLFLAIATYKFDEVEPIGFNETVLSVFNLMREELDKLPVELVSQEDFLNVDAKDPVALYGKKKEI